MPFKLINTLIAIVALAIISCKPKTADAPIGEIATYDTEEFKTFYDRFSTDSAYQMAHITFPLEGMRAMKDSTDIVSPDFRWQPETWVLHQPYDDANGTFTRQWRDIMGGNIVIESIADGSGSFSMERRWGKLSDGWNLIYYREMGRY
jgi:hypothetical protein